MHSARWMTVTSKPIGELSFLDSFMFKIGRKANFQKIRKILFMCFLIDSIKESIHSKFELPIKFCGGIIHH